MEPTFIIYKKLGFFIKKYYTNELIKGAILFIGLGLLYFIFIVFIEHFLWLKPAGRTFLFLLFIIIELYLLSVFIVFPIFKLFNLQKGIDYNEASKIIGNHFSDVSDKLTNFLQLSNEDNSQSELLLASISQKANALAPIPFSNAINFNKNKRYLPWAILPILFFVFFYISGNSSIISQSLDRVVHFEKQFSPPAPFQFKVLNAYLQTEQGDDFVLKVQTTGKIIPENALIFIDNESYYMKNAFDGSFEYRFSRPLKDIHFHIEANNVVSTDYVLAVIAVPTVVDFEMQLTFPSYLNKNSQLITGTGNAIVPEGTVVSWRIKTLATESIAFSESKSIKVFTNKDESFVYSKKINQNIDYQIITSNKALKNYEKYNYQLAVVKDQFPTLEAKVAPDSLVTGNNVIVGQAADDYGLSKLQIVYYPKNNPKAVFKSSLNIKRSVFDQFVYSFPANLSVQEGVAYHYYFEVFDNDAAHGHKSVKSSVFSNRISTEEEMEDQLFEQQNDNINSLSKSLDKQNIQLLELNKLQKVTKEKDNLEFNDQQKVNDFIKRQNQQDEMMKAFSNKIAENLEKSKFENNDELKDQLQKRLEDTQEEIEKNKKLLDELDELNKKMNQDEIIVKMDKFKQKSKNQVKNLEQLVELTKKYYVEKKAEQLANKLDKLSDEQEKLANNEKENNYENQSEINKKFDDIMKDLNDLDKENNELKNPLDLPNEDEKEKSISDDLNNASKELQKESKSKAKSKQNSASKKMKELSSKMKEEMESGDKEQMEEDVAMLRQILDNLLAFSFSQEDLMNQFKALKRVALSFNKNLKIQQDLRLQFQHVDDSLFALSLRNPKIGEEITKEVGNIHYNIDKSLESFVESLIPKGTSHQQYTISSSNKLADQLSETLNNMQMSMSGTGKGKPKPGQGQGMQLPDIIKKQEGLGEKIKQGQKPGEKPGEGKDGKSGKPNGKSGSQKEGQQGDDGEGNAKEIMEIYKEQRQLREALQNELNKKGLGGNGQNAIEQMRSLEKQILNNNSKKDFSQRIQNIKQELLKLDKAVREQGEEQKRKAETSIKQFSNQSSSLSPSIKDYLNSIEILNRQSLPLRTNFDLKVQEYFKQK